MAFDCHVSYASWRAGLKRKSCVVFCPKSTLLEPQSVNKQARIESDRIEIEHFGLFTQTFLIGRNFCICLCYYHFSDVIKNKSIQKISFFKVYKPELKFFKKCEIDSINSFSFKKIMKLIWFCKIYFNIEFFTRNQIVFIYASNLICHYFPCAKLKQLNCYSEN